MSAHAARTPVETVDSSVDSAGSAFESVKQGAYEIQARASEALPATGRFLGRVVYNSAYAVSFGVTFPVMMVVRVMPKDNVLVHGLVDGAMAARDRVHDWGGEMEEDLLDSEADASDNGSVDPDDSTEHAAHRRSRAKRGGARKTSARRTSSRKKS
jgi:hypothetical protein